MPYIASIVEKHSKKSVCCVCGPTAVGKTDVAIQLAESLDTEIISFDSRQFYRELPIGTAAPNDADLKRVKHNFILDRSIEEEVNAASFATEALAKIEALHQKFDTLILVGGSGLYLKAITEGFDAIPQADPQYREELRQELDLHGLAPLQKELALKDPEYHLEVDLNNPQRVIRALEVIRSTGKAFSSFRAQEKRELPFEVRYVGLQLERSELYDRINRRVGLMVAQGLLEEAEAMLAYKNHNALQTVGYKELFPYFEGQYPLEEALDEIRKNSRRYAKRQMTWFRKLEAMEWFHPQEIEKILHGYQ